MPTKSAIGKLSFPFDPPLTYSRIFSLSVPPLNLFSFVIVCLTGASILVPQKAQNIDVLPFGREFFPPHFSQVKFMIVFDGYNNKDIVSLAFVSFHNSIL